MTDSVVWLFGEIANAFHWPVAGALIVLLAYAVFDLGAVAMEAWQRRQTVAPEVDVLAGAVEHLVVQGRHDDALNRVPPAVGRFWQRIEKRLAHGQDVANADLWMDEAVRREELTLGQRLDRGRAIVRLGPMLGLAGTIIPLGPALESLLGGNMADMVGHLVIGFGAVVVGLVMSGIAYFTTLVRERWMRRELKNLESLCELIMRGIRARQRDEATARHREVEYAGV